MFGLKLGNDAPRQLGAQLVARAISDDLGFPSSALRRHFQAVFDARGFTNQAVAVPEQKSL